MLLCAQVLVSNPCCQSSSVSSLYCKNVEQYNFFAFFTQPYMWPYNMQGADG